VAEYWQLIFQQKCINLAEHFSMLSDGTNPLPLFILNSGLQKHIIPNTTAV
jgi:hypothetical protein